MGSVRQYAVAALDDGAVCVAVGDVRQYTCAADAAVEDVGSRHRPNHPGLVQVVVVVGSPVVVVSLVVLSLQPNQPGCSGQHQSYVNVGKPTYCFASTR